MSEEETIEAVASEQPDVQQTGEQEEQPQEEQKKVPLAALQAERKKRQEAEAKANFYEQNFMKSKAEAEPEEDPNALVEKSFYTQDKQVTKRDILEEVYRDMNPSAVKEVNKHLSAILEKKPWLAESVDNAPNRWARAYEIVNDYKHLAEGRQSKTTDAERIVQNAQKPRSTAEIGKTAQAGGKEFLKSIQGKPEFREYRQKLRRGEL